jgi:hypothetical protein
LFRAGRAALAEELGWSLKAFDKAFISDHRHYDFDISPYMGESGQNRPEGHPAEKEARNG